MARRSSLPSETRLGFNRRGLLTRGIAAAAGAAYATLHRTVPAAALTPGSPTATLDPAALDAYEALVVTLQAGIVPLVKIGDPQTARAYLVRTYEACPERRSTIELLLGALQQGAEPAFTQRSEEDRVAFVRALLRDASALTAGHSRGEIARQTLGLAAVPYCPPNFNVRTADIEI